MKHTKLSITGAIIAGLFASAPVFAAGGEHPDTPESELRYKGAPVPIDPGSAQESFSPKGPKMTAAEFARAKNIFFERCAGCHGVLRK
ncbi:MAG: nitrite reductase, partial [Gammaproteobacteria bacterium]|nr:nitrite reductase [Gammaproteobacteria bacterium]